MLLFFCKSDYKWKSLVSGEQSDAKTPFGHGVFSDLSIPVGWPDFGLRKQNQKDFNESRPGNPTAGNSNYLFLA